MSGINDGGNAFPSIDAKGFVSDGMSLRDYFAAHASDSDVKRWMEIYSLNGTPITEEESKYTYADAMLAERQKERGGDE